MSDILKAQVVLPKQVEYASKKNQSFKETIHHQDEKMLSSVEVGKANESYVSKLLRLLEVDFFLTEEGSYYDTICKADIIIKQHANTEVWLQIKSSEHGVYEHVRKFPNSYASVWVPSGIPVQDLKVLKSTFGFQLKPDVIQGLKLHKKLAKGAYPLGIYQKIFKPYLKYLTILGLIGQVGNSLVIR